MLVLTRPKASALVLLVTLLAQGSACSQEIRQFDGASGGAGGAGGEGGTAGSGAPVEDCLNGDDDDGDGKRDCDDEDCAPDFECIAPAPEGWIGPVSIFKGPAAEAPTCPAELPDTVYSGYADLAAEPAQCSACSCDPASVSLSCFLDPLEAYGIQGCNGGKNLTGQNNGAQGMCVFKSIGNLPMSFRASFPQASPSGACAPSAAQATLPPPLWASTALACSRAALGKGCGTQVCAPRAKPPFEAALCIVQKGDLECPAPFSSRRTFTDDPNDVVDMRGCEACACNPPKGECSAVTTLYNAQDCNGDSLEVPNDETCVNAGGFFQVESFMVKVTTQASCEPAGGAPTGAIAPANTALTTVCCMP